MKSRFRRWLERTIRRWTEWAWKDILDNRYTHLEVAEWLNAYKDRYRELTLTEWVARERARHEGTTHRT